MAPRSGYTVGAVARLARVTVRALHHYDETGLLRPSGRTPSGYRTYSRADLERLQRILCYRQLGLPLRAIGAFLDAPAADRMDQLARQRQLLGARIEELGRMLETVDKMMEAHRMGLTLDPGEMLEVFGDDDPALHAAEAESRWGTTDAWADSRRRTARYGKPDWLRIRAEWDEICLRYAKAQAAGAVAAGADAVAVAEAHRQYLTRWFYPCSPPMHARLAELYVSDARFADHFDRRAAGLNTYIHDAICANAAARG